MPKFLKTTISGTCILILILYTFGLFKLDIISFFVLTIAALPWLSPWLMPSLSKWIESIKIGDFEAKFRQLEQTVVETKKELDKFKALYLEMEEDFLNSCLKFDSTASTKDLNKLGSLLKSKAKGLSSIDFIFSNLNNNNNQALAYGAACALQVRPQFHTINLFISLLESVTSSPTLQNFRLITIFRSLMAINQIRLIDKNRKYTLLTIEQKENISRVLDIIINHPLCKNDDTAAYAAKIKKHL